MRTKPLVFEEVAFDVGRRIAELRVAADLTQEQLATKAEISWKYLQQVEAGGENLTIQSLVKFANILGATMIDLMAPPHDREIRPGRPPKARRTSPAPRRARSRA
jgi:transcriptional regulator with XRE-family HTH domain